MPLFFIYEWWSLKKTLHTKSNDFISEFSQDRKLHSKPSFTQSKGETFMVNYNFNFNNRCVVYLATSKERKKQHYCRNNFNFNNRCVVYLATSKKREKQHYCRTTNSFKHKWNNYKCISRKLDRGGNCMQEYFCRHLDIMVYQNMCWILSNVFSFTSIFNLKNFCWQYLLKVNKKERRRHQQTQKF